MTRAEDLQRLAALAALLREARLAEAGLAEARCARTRAERAALDAPLSPEGAPAIAAARHRTWQALRREALTVRLAAETAAAIEARERARAAFGRAEVLAALAARAAAARRRGG